MSTKKENAAILGVGAAACAVCCAGPILGVLAAIGIGTAAGFALFGAVAVVGGALAVTFVVLRRRQRTNACVTTPTLETVTIELTDIRTRS